MDRKAVAFARSWATRYVRTKHPHGLDEGDVENRILESLYKYGRGKMNGRDRARPSQDGAATSLSCLFSKLVFYRKRRAVAALFSPAYRAVSKNG